MTRVKIINPFNILSVCNYQQSKSHRIIKPVIDIICSILRASQPDERYRARLIAASTAHSGDWLQALPISFCGLRFDDEAVKVAVGIRLGTNLCFQRHCLCGILVDCRGAQGLPCKRSSVSIARHSYINDIIHSELVRVKIASVKEPVGLSRTDGKHPNGLTLIPWQVGKNLVWDVTVADTLVNSYLTSTSITAGSAADLAASRKEDKCIDMATNYIFVPMAFETLGPVCSKALVF